MIATKYVVCYFAFFTASTSVILCVNRSNLSAWVISAVQLTSGCIYVIVLFCGVPYWWLAYYALHGVIHRNQLTVKYWSRVFALYYFATLKSSLFCFKHVQKCNQDRSGVIHIALGRTPFEEYPPSLARSVTWGWLLLWKDVFKYR